MNATLLLRLLILLWVRKPLFDSQHLETIETPLLLNFTFGEGLWSQSLSKGTLVPVDCCQSNFLATHPEIDPKNNSKVRAIPEPVMPGVVPK